MLFDDPDWKLALEVLQIENNFHPRKLIVARDLYEAVRERCEATDLPPQLLLGGSILTIQCLDELPSGTGYAEYPDGSIRPLSRAR